MQEISTDVTLRQLIPSDGMCIHKIDTNEYYYDFENKAALSPYIGKDESIDNYEEVPIKDVPRPEPPEEIESSVENGD